jgi:hypothetical protein
MESQPMLFLYFGVQAVDLQRVAINHLMDGLGADVPLRQLPAPQQIRGQHPGGPLQRAIANPKLQRLRDFCARPHR